MTKLLEKAIEAVQRLPDAEQDALAAIVLQEIESERHWTELFDKSQDALARLAAEALEEHDAGKTRPL